MAKAIKQRLLLRLNVRFTTTVLLCFASISFSVLVKAAPSDVPPIRSFLAVPESVAYRIRRGFELTEEDLPAGLYFTHLDEGRSRVDVDRGFPEPVPMSARYLAEETLLKGLYGEAAWKVRPLMRYTLGDSEKPTGHAFDEFAWSARSVNYLRRDQKMARQLWVRAPNGARWMLREQNAIKAETRFFSEIPRHLLPIANGAALIAADGSLSIAFVNGISFSAFTHVGLKGEHAAGSVFRVATRRETSGWGDQIDRPILFYSESTRRLLFAGWPATAGSEDHSPLEDGDTASLFIVDIDATDPQAVEVWRNIRWPFHLSASGIFTTNLESGEVFHRSLQWERAAPGAKTTVPVPADFHAEFRVGELLVRHSRRPTDAKGSVFYLGSEGQLVEKSQSENERLAARLDEKDLYRMELLGYPPDLLGRVRTGEEFTFLQDPEVHDRLARALGADKETAVALLYEDGDLPRTTLTSFLWNLENRSRTVPPALQAIRHTFYLEKSRLVDSLPNRNPHPVAYADSIQNIADSTVDKNAMVVFEGLPSSVEPGAIANFKTLVNRFSNHTRQGRVRVVYLIKKDIWNHLKLKHTALTRELVPIVIGAMPNAELRRANMRALMDTKSIGDKIPFNGAAFQRVLEIAEVLREESEQRGTSETAFLNKMIGDLFAYAKTENLKTEITDAFVDKYRQHKARQYGHWRIEVGAVPTLDGKGNVDEPLWVSPWTKGDRVLKMESLLKLWRAEPEYLVTAPAFPHALFHIPDGAEVDGSKLLLLRPSTKPHVILRNVDVRFIRLHPDGFFLAAVDDKKLKILFFEIANRLDGKDAPPGKLRTLSDEYKLDDFADGTISFRYARGKLSVSSAEGERVFGPQGEEDPDVR